MNRAQEIRQKRLNERREAEEKKRKEELMIEDEAKKLYDWVLDLLENPTEFNSADEVHLSNTYYNKIQIGYKFGKGVTEKEFEGEVMKKLAEIFNAEEGYSADYYSGNSVESDSSVTIKIE